MNSHLPISIIYMRIALLAHFVRNSKFLSSFGSSSFEYFSSINTWHSLAESVFILSLSYRWLKCSFCHRSYIFFWRCKIRNLFNISNFFSKKL